MKKNIYLFVIAISFSANIWAQAPTFSWVKQFGGTNTETGRCVAVDANGNVYSTGVFSGTTDFDPGAGTYDLITSGGQDVYVTKQDSLGNLTWAVKIGGTVVDNSQSIKVDNSGNVYVTGSFNGSCFFGLTNLVSSGMGDAYVCKLDNAGNFLWAKRMGGTGNDAALGVHVDGSGNVFTTGYFTGLADFDPDGGTVNLSSSGGLDIFVSKLDASGAYLAAYKMGGPNFDLGFDITLDGTGNIYTTGYFNGSVDFDPGAGITTLNAGTGEDIFISKLDAAGNSIWAKNMSGTSFGNVGYAVAVDGSGNVYTTGYFSGMIDFDPGVGTANLNSVGGSDAFVSKLDVSGNFVWVKQTGGSGDDGAYSVSLDPGGNLYTAGDFQNTVDFDPGAGTFDMTSSTFDVYVSKLDASGNFVTALQIATNNGDPFLTVDNASRVYITGGFLTTTDFDAGAGVSDLTVVGGTDAYVTRYIIPGCAVPSQPGAISGLSPVCAGSSNTYSVSSVAGATSYTWTLPSGWTGTSTIDTINTTASTTSGNISVTANNACGSSVPQALAITVSNPVLNLFVTGPSCSDSCDASINPVASGGIPPYIYIPFPLTDLCAANYTVTVADQAGCTSTATTTISNPAPVVVTINASDTILCAGDFSAITLTGADTYAWDGLPSSSSFNYYPTVSDTIIAIGTNTTTGCIGEDNIQFIVNPLPVVNFNYSGADTVCTNYAIQILSGGTPAGGTYSGPGVTGINFDPNSAGVGSHTIIYSYTDANSCASSDTSMITVIGCAGVEDWETAVMIYPNPFTDFIQISGLKENTEVKLYNMLGEMMYTLNFTQSNGSLHAEGLSSGVYLLRIGTRTIKLIKK